MKLIFDGTTLEGREGGSGEETIAKEKVITFQRAMPHFLVFRGGNRVKPSVAAPGGTKLSDATV